MNIEEEFGAESIERQDERKDWIYLTIKGVKGEEHYLGKVDLSESIDSIIQKYREIDNIPKNCIIVLRHCGRCINDIKTLAGIGLDPNEICKGVTFNAGVRLCGGGYSEAFIDVEKANITKLSFKKGPKYREVTRGLNFFGICNCKLCVAKDKTVYMKFGMGTFNYFELISKNKFTCPMCESSVFPESCGFWDCRYEIKGEGIKKGETKLRSFSKTGTASSDYFDRFDSTTSFEDKVNYTELIFTVFERY